MILVKVRIEGVSGLLMNRWREDDKDQRLKVKNLKQVTDDVDGMLYRDEDGTVCQPSTHLIGALKNAGVKVQIPGQGKTTYKNMMGSGAVLILPDMIPHEIPAYDIDVRPVLVKGTGGRVSRRRPLFKKWALSFDLLYDEELVSKEVMKHLLDYAGSRVGIGDFRPAKGGPFGRFIVTTFEDAQG